MKKPWARVRNKLYIFIPILKWELQIGLKWHNVSLWTRKRRHQIYTSRKTKKFLEG